VQLKHVIFTDGPQFNEITGFAVHKLWTLNWKTTFSIFFLGRQLQDVPKKHLFVKIGLKLTDIEHVEK
jgi:hypothetical protein